MTYLEPYQDLLHQDFPNLQINSISLIGEGWYTQAALVNDNLIFRFPGKHNLNTSNVKTEINILNHFKDKLPVAIPEPSHIAPNGTYFGYPIIPGKEVASLNFSEAEDGQLMTQWINIVQNIQAGITTEVASTLRVRYFDMSTAITNAKRYMNLPLSKPIKAFISETISYAEQANSPQTHWTFIHGDIHLNNLLADESTHKLTGLLDWTEASIGPLEAEFSIWEWEHTDKLERAALLYQQTTGRAIDVAKAKMWRHIDEISDMVELYEEKNSQEFERSQHHIEQWVKEKI